jgi:acyl dehydratase
MASTTTQHAGPWRRLANLSADRKGSIHDDEAAQSLGFEGAFVPGSTVATAAMPGLAALLGSRWFEGGWYDFKFVTPVYTNNDIREEGGLAAEGRAELRVVTSDGRLCCSGQAGLGFERPWDESMDGRRGAELVLPGLEIGLRFDDVEMSIGPESNTPAADGTTPAWSRIRAMLAAAGDTTPWYEAASPFGKPLVPPEALHNFALQITRGRRLPVSGVRNPGMWAEHALTVRQPLFQDEEYVMREWVADKGTSGRTVFLDYQFEVLSEGQVLAIGRHKVKWLRE